MNGMYPDYLEIFQNLIKIGFKVILAHPERYISIQRDFNKIYELEQIGVLFQCNLGSILGQNGNLLCYTKDYNIKDVINDILGKIK